MSVNLTDVRLRIQRARQFIIFASEQLMTMSMEEGDRRTSAMTVKEIADHLAVVQGYLTVTEKEFDLLVMPVEPAVDLLARATSKLPPVEYEAAAADVRAHWRVAARRFLQTILQLQFGLDRMVYNELYHDEHGKAPVSSEIRLMRSPAPKEGARHEHEQQPGSEEDPAVG